MSEVTARRTSRDIPTHQQPGRDEQRTRSVLVPPADVFEHAGG